MTNFIFITRLIMKIKLNYQFNKNLEILTIKNNNKLKNTF